MEARRMCASRFRFGSIAGMLIAGCCLGSGCHGDACKSGEGSDAFLRSVPAAEPGAGGGGEAAGAGGDARTVVSKQTYTIDPQGEFTLTQVLERQVGYLGVDVVALEGKAAERLDVEPYTGVLVRGTHRDGPAAKAGVLSDDIITSFAGKPVNSTERLGYLIEQGPPGMPVEIEVQRKGQKALVQVELGSETLTESSRALGCTLPVIDDRSRTGLRLAEITEVARPYVLGASKEAGGLLVLENLPGGPAFHADLRIRDCIVKAAGQPVSTIAQYSAVVDPLSEGSDLSLALLRDGKPIEKTLTVDEDAMDSWGFDALGLVKYESAPADKEFSLLWDLLFDHETQHCVQKRENYPENSTVVEWGTVLHLIHWRSTPKKKELRLLWLFPIRVEKG